MCVCIQKIQDIFSSSSSTLNSETSSQQFDNGDLIKLKSNVWYPDMKELSVCKELPLELGALSYTRQSVCWNIGGASVKIPENDKYFRHVSKD